MKRIFNQIYLVDKHIPNMSLNLILLKDIPYITYN